MITKSPEHLKLQKLRVFLFLEWSQLTALDAALQVEHLLLDLGHDSEKFFIFLAAGIIQAPILPMGTGERGTLDIAAHGNDDIYRRKVGERFIVLGLFHIDAVYLFHQAYRVGIDSGAGFSAGRKAIKHIAGQFFAQCLGHLAAAGVVNAEKSHLGLFVVSNREGAALADALVVLTAVRADGESPFHLHPKMLPGKVNSGQDGQKGIPFTAPGAARLADAFQRPSGHLVAQPPRFLGQWCGLRGNGQKLSRTDPSPAGAPKAAGSAGNFFAPAVHLAKGGFQIQAASGIFIGGEQSGSHHDMVFRAVHMAEGEIHHPSDNGHRVFGGLRETQAKDAVHALGMAVIAHIVSVYAARFAGFFFMADSALHDLILDQIFQGRPTNQTFFPVQTSVSSHFCSAACCSGV